MSADEAKPTEDALPPHEILGPLDDPPFRIVYRARDVAHDRIVALTVVRVEALKPDAAEAFLREVRAAAVLHHPSLLPILAVGLHDGRPAYTTPIPPNGDLWSRQKPFADPRAAAELVEKLARAAAAAHAHGLLHGGINPHAIFFDEKDQPQIGGFGLLPFLYSAQREGPGMEMGVPSYSAPEQFTLGPGFVEVPTDVWALGIALYESLTGRRPFEGGPAEMVPRIISADPVAPRRLRPEIDRDLEAVVLHCLEKKPDDRYPSARRLAEELERWRLGQPTVVRPATWTQRILRALRRKSPGAP